MARFVRLLRALPEKNSPPAGLANHGGQGNPPEIQRHPPRKNPGVSPAPLSVSSPVQGANRGRGQRATAASGPPPRPEVRVSGPVRPGCHLVSRSSLLFHASIPPGLDLGEHPDLFRGHCEPLLTILLRSAVLLVCITAVLSYSPMTHFDSPLSPSPPRSI